MELNGVQGDSLSIDQPNPKDSVLRFNPNANAAGAIPPEQQAQFEAIWQAYAPAGAPRPAILGGPAAQPAAIGQGQHRAALLADQRQANQDLPWLQAPPGAVVNRANRDLPANLADQRAKTPAQQEFDLLLNGGWLSDPFNKYYVIPSEKFKDDSKTGRTALMLAADSGDEDAARALLSFTILSYHAEDDCSDYFEAICCDEFHRLKQDGLSVDSPDYVQIPSKSGQSSSLEPLRRLRQEALNARAPDGRSPLMFAASSGHVGVATLLLNLGAKIDDQSDDGRTALEFALMNGHDDMVNFLRNVGASR